MTDDTLATDADVAPSTTSTTSARFTATTHWQDAGLLRAAGAEARDDVHWVDAGDVITRAASSGIAMALHLVERDADRVLADACARQIDYVRR